MADWNVDLPGEAEVGDDTHVQDHNTLVAAVLEARSALDALEASLEAIDAGAITTGTLNAARVPSLAITKTTGLQAALDGKADASALSALGARVTALEPDED